MKDIFQLLEFCTPNVCIEYRIIGNKRLSYVYVNIKRKKSKLGQFDLTHTIKSANIALNHEKIMRKYRYIR